MSNDIPEHLAPLLRIQRKRDLDGSFGNQLSQYGIWKTVATGTAYGVILEDDAFVRCRGLGQLSFADLAPGADIIFLNDRLAPAMTSNEDGQIGLDRLEDVLVTLSFRMDRRTHSGLTGMFFRHWGPRNFCGSPRPKVSIPLEPIGISYAIRLTTGGSKN